MKKLVSHHGKPVWVTFSLVFTVCLAVGVAISLAQPVSAAQNLAPQPQESTVTPTPEPNYAGSDACATCHKDTHGTWTGTLHSQAFASPIFQEDWIKQGEGATCLECHTTGFDSKSGKFAEAGVTCEACHGPLQQGHPQTPIRGGRRK